MLSIFYHATGLSPTLDCNHQASPKGRAAYPEILKVLHRDGIAEEVEEGILEHAAMAVPSYQLLTPSYKT
jgi:hypothetical protein